MEIIVYTVIILVFIITAGMVIVISRKMDDRDRHLDLLEKVIRETKKKKSRTIFKVLTLN